jgi:gas vesicle protein
MKTILIFVLLGAVLGAAAASIIVPPTLSWYNEAGFLSQSGQASQVQALVNIPQVIRYATSRLIRGQLIGAAVGAVAFLVIGILAASRGRGRVAPIPASPRPPGERAVK